MKEIAPGIVLDESTGSGMPMVKGTRVEVSTVLSLLAAGVKPEEIAREYGLGMDDVLTCMAFGLHLLLQGQIGGAD